MNTLSELNQANNRNGDLLTDISKLQHENAKLRAQLNEWLAWDSDSDRVPRPPNEIRQQSDAEPVAWRVKDFADNWILCTRRGMAEVQAENAGKLIQPLYTAPPRPDASAGLIEASILLDNRADEHKGRNDDIERSYRMSARFLRACAADRSAK